LVVAVAEDGYFTFPGLIGNVAVPAGAVIAALAIAAAMARWHRLWAGILLGAWTGLAGTALMEVIRETGFRAFHSMPGDLVQLMGVLLTNRIMSGPSLWSATGAGFFGDLMAPQFAITVYLAHMGFGALAGWLVHRFGAGLDPIWTPALDLARRFTRRDSPPGHVPAGAGRARPRS
jgi:hypothetical protein